MNSFKKINNITGWIVFGIALLVYTLTMEKSGSFWDCGEFVPVAAKLEIAHPPGAPFFSVLGRVFTVFAEFGTPQPAIMINFLSALSTAFVSLFCFWTVTYYANKMLIKKEEDNTTSNIFAIMGAGIVAALVSTFADSIWFSAVEGEVYALSIFFMTFIVWASTKWERDNSQYADRWLVLIFFMIGLSTGVHLLSLLALPFLGITIFYKKFKFNPAYLLIAFVLSFGLVIFVMQGIIVGIPYILSKFELIFVNSFGASFNTGVYVGIIFLIAAVVGAIFLTHQKRAYYANLIMMCLAVLMLGYSTYITVPIRAAANPPINMNKPTDVFSMLSYLKREQYGERPLLNGPAYTAENALVANGGDIIKIIEKSPSYIPNEKTGKYDEVKGKQDYVYADEVKMFFPRLGVLGDKGKVEAYRAWINPPYAVYDRENRTIVTKFKPSELQKAEAYVQQMNAQNTSKFGTNRYRVKDILTWGDNIGFFFEYQVGYMYMRYFMWNFSGRQNDIQGKYSNSDGGWIVGIDAIDDAIGTTWGNPEWTQKDLSPYYASNFANNKFYAIPFIFGIVGFIFILLNDKKFAFVSFVLFLSTGVFFIVYGNQPPIEPRERDYVIAGSIFTYAMYIGFAVIAIYKGLKKVNPTLGMGAAFAIVMIAPLLMGFEGWDDHDRSGRTTAVDFASNYLNSCEPNAIIFTQGDNDTYPLWYAQEIEGIRTDVRVVNLSLLGVDWYVNHLRYKMNDADPVKLTFTPEMLSGGKRDYVQYFANPKLDPNKFYDAQEIMAFVAKDDPNFAAMNQSKIPYHLPTKKFAFPIDKEKAAAIGLIDGVNDSTSLDQINFTLKKNALMKFDLIVLDIIANNINERPIYFAISVSPSSFMGLQQYFEQEGLTYRIVPRINATGQPTSSPINVDEMYDNVMNKFKFGQIDTNPDVYIDENISRMTLNLVSIYTKLADKLVQEGELTKAVEVLDRSLETLPTDRLFYNYFHADMPSLYAKAGEKEKGDKLAQDILAFCEGELQYFERVYQDKIEIVKQRNPSLLPQYQAGIFTQNREVMEKLYLLQQIQVNYQRVGDTENANLFEAKLNEYTNKLKAI